MAHINSKVYFCINTSFIYDRLYMPRETVIPHENRVIGESLFWLIGLMDLHEDYKKYVTY